MRRSEKLYRDLGAAIDNLGGVACENIPDAFFYDPESPQRYEMIRIAKSLCDACPLKLLCLEYALEAEEEHGIWGGMTPINRAQMRRLRKRVSSSV
jgi:hypothetical protein